jgi:hypothetical protein
LQVFQQRQALGFVVGCLEQHGVVFSRYGE